MFDSQGGRNRYRKPVMYDLAADSEWGVLSPRPLGRWTKRRPTRRALVLLACVFVAAVYGVRVWNARQHGGLRGAAGGGLDVDIDAGDAQERVHPHEHEHQHQEHQEQQNEHQDNQEQQQPPPPNWDDLPKPPLFGRYHEAEMALPQHHVADPFAGGKKYLWVENHVHALGWGNYMQDLVMNAQLAYSAGRSFVFDNFTWNRDGSVYSDYNGKLIPSQIPLSALISGPLAGGPFLEDDHKFRAIAREYWHKICPEPLTVWTYDVKKIINDDQATAGTVLKIWLEQLSTIDEPCVQIDGGVERIFDMYMYGQKERVLDIWPVLSKSPLLTLFGYSPLIHAAFDVNRDLLTTLPVFDPYYPCSTAPSAYPTTGIPTNPPQRCSDPYAPIPGLLALHLRRGDFSGHCQHLGRWGAAWMGFNSFPSFVDQWVPLAGGGWGETTEENMAVYMKRCYPTIEQIVEKVDEVRRSPGGRGLRNVYVMTNGKREWVQELKDALFAMGGWEKVASSRDMLVTREQKEVAQAVDMMIGERAQVLIGNGWSSMTSNIVMMRMARGQPPETNRFW